MQVVILPEFPNEGLWGGAGLSAQISGGSEDRDCVLHSLGSFGSVSSDTAMVLLHTFSPSG